MLFAEEASDHTETYDVAEAVRDLLHQIMCFTMQPLCKGV